MGYTMPPMFMGFQPGMWNPQLLWIELAYTIIVVILCFLVYIMTKEIYELTKHKGIKYFRYAFLFFGLSYATRFLFQIFHLSGIAFDFGFQRRMIGPYSLVIVGYLSTMAIFYLTYSTLWKKIQYDHFITGANFLAVVVSLFALVNRSPAMLGIIQLILLTVTIIVSVLTHKTEKKFSSARGLYLLIALFWFLNLFVLTPGRMVSLEIKIVLQLVSIAVFGLIVYRINKWVK